MKPLTSAQIFAQYELVVRAFDLVNRWGLLLAEIGIVVGDNDADDGIDDMGMMSAVRADTPVVIPDAFADIIDAEQLRDCAQRIVDADRALTFVNFQPQDAGMIHTDAPRQVENPMYQRYLQDLHDVFAADFSVLKASDMHAFIKEQAMQLSMWANYPVDKWGELYDELGPNLNPVAELVTHLEERALALWSEQAEAKAKARAQRLRATLDNTLDEVAASFADVESMEHEDEREYFNQDIVDALSNAGEYFSKQSRRLGGGVNVQLDADAASPDYTLGYNDGFAAGNSEGIDEALSMTPGLFVALRMVDDGVFPPFEEAVTTAFFVSPLSIHCVVTGVDSGAQVKVSFKSAYFDAMMHMRGYRAEVFDARSGGVSYPFVSESLRVPNVADVQSTAVQSSAVGVGQGASQGVGQSVGQGIVGTAGTGELDISNHIQVRSS